MAEQHNMSVRDSYRQDPEIADRARNPAHLERLVDVALARKILEGSFGERAYDYEITEARQHLADTKDQLETFIANGYRDSPPHHKH